VPALTTATRVMRSGERKHAVGLACVCLSAHSRSSSATSPSRAEQRCRAAASWRSRSARADSWAEAAVGRRAPGVVE
jgi:hypothetical protein